MEFQYLVNAHTRIQYTRDVQTILPKEPNYMGTKNSSIQNVQCIQKFLPKEPNLVPEPQVWTTLST